MRLPFWDETYEGIIIMFRYITEISIFVKYFVTRRV